MTFLQPVYLLGTTLSAIPIIIHLWYRKRLKTVPFSALKFLKEKEARRFGWLRFREILVLILRCLIIIFIFFSLAKPQFTGSAAGTGRLASVVCIIDNSYSMAYGDLFDSLKTITKKTLSAYSLRSEFLVVGLCSSRNNKSDSSVSTQWVMRDAAIEQVYTMKPTYQTGTIKEAYSRINLTGARYDIEFIYIGDGQEHNFIDFPDEISKDGHFQWIQLPIGSNVGVTEVKVVDPVTIPINNYTLRAMVNNYSSRMWHGSIVLSSGSYHHTEECEVQGNDKQTVDFFLSTHMLHGTVTLHSDSLPIDNIYFFSKTLPQVMRVLLVGQNRFIVNALDTSEEQRSPFDYDITPSLGNLDIRNYNAVIIDGVAELSEPDVIKLSNFLSTDGCGIVCFLGENIGPRLRTFVEPVARVNTPVTPQGYVTLDWIDIEHPVFTVYPDKTSLQNTRFYFYHNVTPHAQTVARVTGSMPLIVVKDNLALVSTRFIPQTTDIIYKPSFVPLLYRLIIYTAKQEYSREFIIGNSNPYKEIKAPSGAYITQDMEFTIPGVYTRGADTIGVNVLPEEGNTKVLGKEAVQACNINVVSSEDQGMRDLSFIFLYAALAAFLLEMVVLLLH
jgi:hypothetical protein